MKTKRTFKIGEREVGPGHPVLVVAELSGNHNGDLDIATKLIEAAHSAVKPRTPRSMMDPAAGGAGPYRCSGPEY